MQRCRRCYADGRTDEQIILGIPHYCKGPRVRPLPPPPTFDYSPTPAPIPTDGSGSKSYWDPIFANYELNRHGIPKLLEDSDKFSYDNSPYFKRPKYGLAALKEKDAGQQGGEDSDQTKSEAAVTVKDSDDMDVDTPRRQEGAPQQRQPALWELMQARSDADAAAASAEASDLTEQPNQAADDSSNEQVDAVQVTEGVTAGTQNIVEQGDTGADEDLGPKSSS